jgi:hypothetical protein
MYTNPFIKGRMTRDQFFNIYRRINFDTNTLFSTLRKIFAVNWFPYQNIAIDETIFLFKGNYCYRQKVPNKPHSTGNLSSIKINNKRN